MAARTALSHAKMSEKKKSSGYCWTTSPFCFCFFVLFVWPVVSCYEVLELKINAAIVRIIQSGRPWLVVLCMLIGQRFLVPCGLWPRQISNFVFTLYWGVEEGAVRPQQDPRRRFHPLFLFLPPPTFASLVSVCLSLPSLLHQMQKPDGSTLWRAVSLAKECHSVGG